VLQQSVMSNKTPEQPPNTREIQQITPTTTSNNQSEKAISPISSPTVSH